MYFMQNGMKNPNAALAGSYDFMHMMGHVCLGLMWTRMAKAAYVALDVGARTATSTGQDRHGPVLHGPTAARLRDASGPDRERGGYGHGAARRGF